MKIYKLLVPKSIRFYEYDINWSLSLLLQVIDFSKIFCYNRCPTLCEKKVEDGFDFPSDKSSVNFWIVCVGWGNLMLQSICDGCWAQAWLTYTRPSWIRWGALLIVPKPLLYQYVHVRTFLQTLFIYVWKSHNSHVIFPEIFDWYYNAKRSFSQGYKNHQVPQPGGSLGVGSMDRGGSLRNSKDHFP